MNDATNRTPRAQADGRVYLGMTQSELDAQYDQRTAVPHAAEYAARWGDWSEETRRCVEYETHAYGDGERETLDLFHSGPPSGAHLHVHGGAWKALSKDDASFTVDGLCRDGLSVAVADFALAPEVSLNEIVAEVRRAFLWLRDWAAARGVPVSVSGHSSGAHLVGCLLHAGWWAEAGLSAEDFAGVVLASGIYDLEPVRLSARNGYLHLNHDDVGRLSPLTNLPRRMPPLAVVWGEHELAEFRRQSRTYADAAIRRSPSFASHELANMNHFDVYDSFRDPTSKACRSVHALSAGTPMSHKQGYKEV